MDCPCVLSAKITAYPAIILTHNIQFQKKSNIDFKKGGGVGHAYIFKIPLSLIYRHKRIH